LNTHNLTNYFKQVVFCAKSLETECPTDGALNVLRHSVDVYYLRPLIKLMMFDDSWSRFHRTFLPLTIYTWDHIWWATPRSLPCIRHASRSLQVRFRKRTSSCATV